MSLQFNRSGQSDELPIKFLSRGDCFIYNGIECMRINYDETDFDDPVIVKLASGRACHLGKETKVKPISIKADIKEEG